MRYLGSGWGMLRILLGLWIFATVSVSACGCERCGDVLFCFGDAMG